jgi:hypothetical protein
VLPGGAFLRGGAFVIVSKQICLSLCNRVLAVSTVLNSELMPALDERLYTVTEIAEVWKLSPDKVRRLFEGEPGVLVFGNKGGFSRRRYRTLRIPQSVLERVYRRLTNVST